MNTITSFSPLTPKNLKQVIEKHLPDAGHAEEIASGHVAYYPSRIANYKVCVGRDNYNQSFIQAKLEDNPHSTSLTITPNKTSNFASLMYRIYSPALHDEYKSDYFINPDEKIPEIFKSQWCLSSVSNPGDSIKITPLIADLYSALYSASVKALEHTLEGFEFVNGSVQKELVK